ncbi:nucleotide pyrophosphohydrolase [Candidatus Bipolaricaulota bacterium]
MDISMMTKHLRDFAKDRDWQQFHSPKNLAMALVVESSELLELFQWLTEEQSRSIVPDSEDHVRCMEEIGDILIYLLRLCDQLQINPLRAAEDKIAENELKYPIADAKGNAVKYSRREARSND